MSPPRQRLLAVDYGDRRTGVAATDFTGTIVVPLPRIDASDPAVCGREVAAIAAERRTEVIVVGLPLDAEGGVGHRARRTLAFIEHLRAVAPCPVATVDETHSTDEAHDLLKSGGLRAARRKELADSVAAMVILERYRATPRRDGSGAG